MQTNLNKDSNFFDRTLRLSVFYGFSGISDLAKALGYASPEKLYRLKKENAKPSVDILQDLSNKFEDLNLNWYITGNGEITLPNGSYSQKTEINLKRDIDIKVPVNKPGNSNLYIGNSPAIVTVDSHNTDNIVLVPQKLSAGYLQGYDDPNFISKLPSYRMPGLNNGIFRMFEIEGNSMFPTFPNKSYVVCQFVENWITGIKDNRVYAIISNEMQDGLIKRCINKIKKYNNLVCKSDNRRNYPNQNINPDSIKEIWEFKLHLNADVPDPTDIHDKLYDLEGEVSSLRGLMKSANLLP